MAAEVQNLDFAKTLWAEMMKIEIKMEERLEHLYRIMNLAVLLRLAPVKYRDPKQGVFDVLCSATTDVATVTGANSRLRSDCAQGVAGGSRLEFCNNPKLLESRLGFKVGAFDGAKSRLCKEMAKESVSPLEHPIPKRPFENCAEHVVFEKLDRLSGQRARFTYALQKIGGSKKQSSFQVKIVERCHNCQVAGGPARISDGEPFGMTARLGRVVTDHPSLINLDVPVITPRVLQYFRVVISTYYNYNFNTGSDDVPPALTDFDNPLVRVWSDTSMQQHGSVRALGPTDATIINQELSVVGLSNNFLDDNGPHPNPD